MLILSVTMIIKRQINRMFDIHINRIHFVKCFMVLSYRIKSLKIGTTTRMMDEWKLIN